jgi:23S rRNA (uridine2552-2'-O)-methyltransferase
MAFKVKDHFFHKAKTENYFARSVYKLEEIDKRFKIFAPGQKVVDLGYHPGSWTQYASEMVGREGIVVGIDLYSINDKLLPLGNVKLFEKDIFDVHSPKDLGVNESFDIVLSDMAPKTTGIKSVDQLKSLALVESIFDLLPKLLKPKGHLVSKIFESQGAQDFLKLQKNKFKEFHYLRPEATRKTSKEYFVIGLGFKG